MSEGPWEKEGHCGFIARALGHMQLLRDLAFGGEGALAEEKGLQEETLNFCRILLSDGSASPQYHGLSP